MNEPQNFNKPMLYDEHPLIVCPSLAMVLGLSEAIFLQQIHFLLRMKEGGRQIDGEKWIWNTYDQWQADHFPFWTSRTVKSLALRLERRGLLRSRQPDGAMSRKKYYRIDYAALAALSVPNRDGETSSPSKGHKSAPSKVRKTVPSITETTRRDSGTETSGNDETNGGEPPCVSFEIPDLGMVNAYWNERHPSKKEKDSTRDAAQAWFLLHQQRGWRTARGTRIQDWRRAFDGWIRHYKPVAADTGTGWQELMDHGDDLGIPEEATRQFIRYNNRNGWMTENALTGKTEPIHDRCTQLEQFWESVRHEYGS